MKTATGTLVHVTVARINAVFVIKDVQNTFNAIVSPSLLAFTSKEAAPHYNNDDDLSSTHSYSGRMGTDTFGFKLKLNNGVVIDGKLNFPGIEPAINVDGSGIWVKIVR